MKIILISDVHANLAALAAFPERDYDQLWCIGDQVNYGPAPREAAEWIGERASVAVRGNHDHAAAFNLDPQCSPAYKKLAAETLAWTRAQCSAAQLHSLGELPIERRITVGATRFLLTHAMPSRPLFGYCAADSALWAEEVVQAGADVLVVGHTHTPFVRRVGGTLIVNPGSLGQPKTGRPLACYAVWQDGAVELREYAYPVEETARAIRVLPIASDSQEALIAVLTTGGVLPPAFLAAQAPL